MYALADSMWTEVGKLKGKARTGDRLGFSVGLKNYYIIAGSYHDDDPVKGKDAGSAYIFSAYNLSDLPSTMPAASIYDQDENIQVSKEEVPEKSVHNVPDNPGEIRVFPNPVLNQLQVQLNNETVEPVEVELLDALGRTIYKKQVLPVNGSMIELDFSEKNIQPGLVFLKIKATDAATKILKLMKQ